MKSLSWYKLIVYSLSCVYILFGFLKILGASPIKPLVVSMLPFMDSPVLFGLFGFTELLLGIGLILVRTRKFAALLIIFHLASTFLSFIFSAERVFSNTTVFSLEGEFVIKNLILAASAYFIYKQESRSLSENTDNF
jgi:uncharacterized membrane protein YkgB